MSDKTQVESCLFIERVDVVNINFLLPRLIQIRLKIDLNWIENQTAMPW